MAISDNSNWYDNDEEIVAFWKDSPDIYNFVLKALDGSCEDADLQAFEDNYGKENLQDFLKITAKNASEKDIQEFQDVFGETLCNAIVKMIQKRRRSVKSPPESDHLQEKFKKGDFIDHQYEVFDVLGEGGFGIVYLVYSHKLKSALALKTFRDEYMEDITTRERFRKEAQVWIDLERHPYLVRAYIAREISSRLYIGLEHIASDEPGMNTLEGYLRRRPPDLAQSLKWAIQFCHGMEYAYSKGVKAHRDIKPANIMIDQNKTLKITDFGLAGVLPTSYIAEQDSIAGKSGNDSSMQTAIGTSIGTPEYMSPEQFTDLSACDERSDIYSFGVVLYQMASGGKLPFLSDNPQYRWAALKHLHHEAPVPKLNSPLFLIIWRCLQKEPKMRYQSFKDLRYELEIILKQRTGEVIKLPEQKELEAWEWFNKGVSLGSLDMFFKAIACFDNALEINPLNDAAWLCRGIGLRQLGKDHDAIACYDRALQINPKETRVWINKGVALSSLCDYEREIACYDRALELDTKNVDAWLNKGIALRQLGKDYDAIACFNKVIEINPRDADAWSYKGLTSGKLGDFHDAIACYDRVLEINPEYVNIWLNKGVVLVGLGKIQEAKACLQKAIEINPKDANAWYGKALAEDKLGHRQDAVRSFKQFLGLSPDKHKEQIEYARKRLRELAGRQ